MDVELTKEDIPLLKAEHIQPFIEYVEAQSGNARALLARAQLPEKLLLAPEGVIPERRAWLFIDIAAKSLNMSDFGLRVGQQIDLSRFGAFINNLIACPTVFTSLGAFCELARQESSGANFWLASRDNGLWFYRGGVAGINFANHHVELYVLMFMIKVVRLKLGEHWVPESISLKCEPCSSLLAYSQFRNVSIKFCQPNTAFKIAFKDAAIAPGTNVGIVVSGANDEKSFVDTLMNALGLYSNMESFSIEQVAEIVGMSSRTLQRRLKESGISFKNLRDRLKLQQSVRLMRAKHRSLTDIALTLGYSDSAHFSRAFQRWTGISPSKYRRSILFQAA